MPDISKLGEAGIISLFGSGEAAEPVIKGIGDDCAAVRLAGDELLLWTTDLLVEEVHFVRIFGTPEQLGMKALAVNLSDIAAMGGTPTACLLGLALPRDLEQDWLRAFRDGFRGMADQFGCQIIGGDTVRSQGLISISATAIGRVGEDKVMWRTGARDGDDIWISGSPGRSELGLRILRDGGLGSSGAGGGGGAVENHLVPVPEISLGKGLGESSSVTSCIDTSDGLVVDLRRLCAANSLGAVLEEEKIPLPAIPAQRDDDPLELALHGGEDYGLLFTAGEGARELLSVWSGLHCVGKMTSSVKGVHLRRVDGTSERINSRSLGYSHF